MFKVFYPDEWVKSTYTIDYEVLYEEGYRGILFDIDNTLVRHNAPADQPAGNLILRLKKIGFKICLVSNNKEKRVKSLADQLGVMYVFKAHKPSRKGFREAMKRMGTDEQTTISVGDQIFTDIYGSNRAGIRSILVKPIDKKEEIQIVLKRYLERIVLFFFRRSDKFKKKNEKNSKEANNTI